MAPPDSSRTPSLRCILSGKLPPALNMALDEALLVTSGPPTLRLYGWSPPGLSLGYFQSSAEFRDLDGPHVVVRRLTGGGAIYHDDEITFALTLDAEDLPAEIPASYELIHVAINKALAASGIRARFATDAGFEGQARPQEPWCLMGGGPSDLVTDSGGKILGSAQRRVRNPRPRVLHHGSIVLRAPSATPGCGAVAETADVAAVDGALEQAVLAEIAAALGLEPVDGAPSEAEHQLAQELRVERYESDGFTHRR